MNPETSRQAEKVLHSECFQGKPQMQSLLRLLLRHWDSQAALKPDRIIAELWSEDSSQKSSPDVAAVIARLRRTLELYYASEGSDDPIVLRLPDRSARTTATSKSAQWIVAEPKHCAELATVDGSQGEWEPSLVEAPQAIAAHPPRSRRITWLWTAVAAALLVVLGFVGFRLFPLNNEPNAAQLVGNTIQIMNSDGTVLWTKSFPHGFWPEFYQNGVATRVWFEDLGDGRKSVLLLYHPASDPQAHSSVLICYSHRGKELWRWTPGRVLPEVGNDPAVFMIRTLAFLKAADGRPQIVALSDHFPRYPAQIALLDGHGKTISEYWHSGHLDHMMTADLDGNGKQEIIASGTANGYKEAVLVVLDQDKISGASVETGELRFQLHNLGVAHERYRLLFPRSDLNIATTRYNFAEGVTMANGAIRVSVQECELNPYCLIWYEFDIGFNLRLVYLDDHFKDAHEAYFRNLVPPRSLEDALLRSEKVRCLVGCSADYVPSLIDQPPAVTGPPPTPKSSPPAQAQR